MGKSYQITEAELKALEELRTQNKDKDTERRLHAVILRGKGMRNIEVAKKLDTAPQVISYWVSRFKREGVDGLLEHRKGGNHRNMTYEEEEEILQKFRDKAIRGELVTLREIKQRMKKRLVRHSERTVRSTNCFIAINGEKSNQDRSMRKKLPQRRSKPQKKINATVAEQTTFHNSTDGKLVRLMFQDEAGFGRISTPSYCWCPGKIRPCVPCHRIREYVYLFGAVEPATGENFFLIFDKSDTENMNVFLNELSKEYHHFPRNL